MPVTYCDRAYEEVMTWTAGTKIKYAPNKKSGKSKDRYEKYMVAKTVGESLSLGSFGLDLLFDFEKGLLWATGGPKRERPPEISRDAGVGKEELKKMSKTDRTLGAMYQKWRIWKKNFALLEQHGMTRKQLKEMNDDREDGCTDSIEVAIGRREAQQKAREILEAKKKGGGKMTDNDVLECLRLWGFKENTNRTNVTPDGEKFVYSDTVGLIKQSTSERTLLTHGTKRYPEFTQVLTQWLKERIPAELKEGFSFTSININKNYAGKLHRDGNNVGPSMIKAFGDFTDGELNYWPGDTKKEALEDLKKEDKVTIGISDKLLLFDGNRGHYVNQFKGERYSLVFFSIRTWNKVPDEDRKEAIACGIPVPTEKTMKYAQSLLGPSKKDGYRVWTLPKEATATCTKQSPKVKKLAKEATATSTTQSPKGSKRKATASASAPDLETPAKKTRAASTSKKDAPKSTPKASREALTPSKEKAAKQAEDISLSAKLQDTQKDGLSDYITKRCQKCNGLTVEKCLGMAYKDSKGNEKTYKMADLRYDLKWGFLKLMTAAGK